MIGVSGVFQLDELTSVLDVSSPAGQEWVEAKYIAAADWYGPAKKYAVFDDYDEGYKLIVDGGEVYVPADAVDRIVSVNEEKADPDSKNSPETE